MILRSRVQLVLMLVLTIAVALPLTAHAGIVVNSVSNAMMALDATPVSISDATVTAAFAGGAGFAIQEADSSAGIRVVSDESITAGNKVSVEGTIDTVGSERVIVASSVTDNGTADAQIEPLKIQSTDIGRNNEDFLGATIYNPDAPEGQYDKLFNGTSSIGLLVLIYGKVTAVNNTGDFDGYFYVNDGGTLVDICGDSAEDGVIDGSGNYGIRCRPVADTDGAATVPAVGDYVEVTGVIGVTQVGDNNVRYLWTESVKQATFAQFSIQVDQGWNLFSLPAQPKNPDPAVVFDGFEIDGRLIGWVAMGQGMTAYDLWCPSYLGALRSSEGYWFFADHAGTVSFTGYADDSSLDRWLSVPGGWRIISTPAYNTNWADWKATDGSEVKSVAEAVAAGWMDEIAKGCNDNIGNTIDESDFDNVGLGGVLKAGKGYWVKSNQNIALLAP